MSTVLTRRPLTVTLRRCPAAEEPCPAASKRVQPAATTPVAPATAFRNPLRWGMALSFWSVWSVADGLFFGLGFVLQEIVEVDVIFADHLHDVPLGMRSKRDLSTPGLSISLRVLDRDVVRHRILIHSPDAFHQMKLRAVRMAGAIQPCFIVEPDGIDH